MCIPKGAKNKAQADSFINFAFDPINAATIEAYVNYVCPVKGAKEEIVKIDPAFTEDGFDAMVDDVTARLKQFRAVTADEERAWSKAFSKVLGL